MAIELFKHAEPHAAARLILLETWNWVREERGLRRDLSHAAEAVFRHDGLAGMLGAPLRAGAAHVVLFGMVGTEKLGTHAAPQVSDGLADARCSVLASHDTFPSSRRVPTAGSAFSSPRNAAWFRSLCGPIR